MADVDTTGDKPKSNRSAKNDDPDPATLPQAAPRVTVPTFTIPTAPAYTPTGPSPGAIKREADADWLKEKKNVGELVASLEGGAARYNLQLVRQSPKVWRQKMISGFLAEFPAGSPPSQDEIKQQYGGGTFFWRVMIPNPRGGPAQFGPTTATFDIAGDPIPPEAPPGSEPPPGSNSQIVEIAKMSMEETRRQAERAEHRVEKILEQNKGDGGSTMQTFMQMQQNQANMMQQQMQLQMKQMEEDRKALALRLEAQERTAKAEREALEARLREDRIAAENRAKEEARVIEARIKADSDAAERRHKEQLALQQQQIADARADADRRAQEAQAAAADRREQDSRNFQLQLAAMEKSNQSQIQMMQTMNQMQVTAFKEMDTMKMGFFEKQLSQKPTDPLDQIEKWKRISDILGGKDDEDDVPVWKQVIDELKDVGREAGPSLLAAAGITANAAAGAKGGGNREQRRKQIEGAKRRRAKPGTVVVVDEDLPDGEAEVTNGLKQLTFPDPSETNQDVLGDALMRNIDWALEQDNNATWIVNNVIKRFPPIVGVALASADAESLIATIKEKVPATWKLNSPAGHKVVREAHAILKKG